MCDDLNPFDDYEPPAPATPCWGCVGAVAVLVVFWSLVAWAISYAV